MFVQCFTTKSRGFTEILKVKICDFKSVLGSCSKKTEPVTRGHVRSSQMRNEAPLQL